MKVWLVVQCIDAGRNVGVFSTEEKANEYIANHSYNAYIIIEYVVDSER